MTEWSADFVSDVGQLFPKTMGEFLAALVRRRWPRDTAKHVSRAWGLDPVTASNLTKGHASERTITKALKNEGWDLLTVLGEALTGQSHHEWEEQRLRRIIEEAERAQESIRSLRVRREELAERAAAVDPHLGRGVAGARRRA